MATVSVHVRVTIWSTTVREQNHDLVNGFRIRREIIPEHIGILQIGLRIAFLSMDEEREFRGISQEEYRSIVHDLLLVSVI